MSMTGWRRGAVLLLLLGSLAAMPVPAAAIHDHGQQAMDVAQEFLRRAAAIENVAGNPPVDLAQQKLQLARQLSAFPEGIEAGPLETATRMLEAVNRDGDDSAAETGKAVLQAVSEAVSSVTQEQGSGDAFEASLDVASQVSLMLERAREELFGLEPPETPSGTLDPLATTARWHDVASYKQADLAAVIDAVASIRPATLNSKVPASAASLEDCLKRLLAVSDNLSSIKVDQSMAATDGYALPDSVVSLVCAFANLLDTTIRYMGDDLGSAQTQTTVDRLWSARHDVLEAVVALQDSLAGSGPVAAAPTLSVPPLFHIDLTASDNVYEQDFLLLVDAGGDDRYENNAGGTAIADSAPFVPDAPIAAVLVDLDGHDVYGTPESTRRGTNGAAINGVGMLVDLTGNDRYIARAWGGNGSASGWADIALGLLLDLSGDDEYQGGNGLASGNSANAYAMLIDGAGTDHYVGGNGLSRGGQARLIDLHGTDQYSGHNGGGWCSGIDPTQWEIPPFIPSAATAIGGQGFLFDGDGNDSYFGGQFGVNGGGAGCAGFLFDGGGDDVYRARYGAVNGGGRFVGGQGRLIDVSGNDVYESEPSISQGGLRYESFGGNGGAYLFATGMLIDMSGDDRYEGGGSANGGSTLAVGALYDGGGHDQYLADAASGANGGSVLGAGVLLDEAGDDAYIVTSAQGANGGSCGGIGVLHDRAGDDVYTAERNYGYGGVNGGAVGLYRPAGDYGYKPPCIAVSIEGDHVGDCPAAIREFDIEAVRCSAIESTGILIDRAGMDVYTAWGAGANGGGAMGGTGVLFDLEGIDSYKADYWGVNGGGYLEGVGFLVDLRGDDSYDAIHSGVNGGGFDRGSGFLLDVSGADRFTSARSGANGGAQIFGNGFLMDGDGDDRYLSLGTNGYFGFNGGALYGGVGTLIDLRGNDRYDARQFGVNGGAKDAVGLLLDGTGNDVYISRQEWLYQRSAANGEAETQCGRIGPGCDEISLAIAALIDVEGLDQYTQDGSGPFKDQTVAPKGAPEDGEFGAQVDVFSIESALPAVPLTISPGAARLGQ